MNKMVTASFGRQGGVLPVAPAPKILNPRGLTWAEMAREEGHRKRYPAPPKPQGEKKKGRTLKAAIKQKELLSSIPTTWTSVKDLIAITEKTRGSIEHSLGGLVERGEVEKETISRGKESSGGVLAFYRRRAD